MNATTDQGNWRRNSGGNAAELERDGDQIRADMDRTLDEIERKLSPSELLDRSLGFFREHGSDFVREAGDTVRRNPVPVMLTAAGLIWLTAAVAGSRSQPSARSRSDVGGSHIDEDAATFSDFADGQGYSTGESAGTRTRANAVRNAGSHFTRLVREQPIALGALALAAGALLGAALPMSQYENSMMGSAHDRAMKRVSEAGRKEYEKVRDAVSSSTDSESDDGERDTPATG